MTELLDPLSAHGLIGGGGAPKSPQIDTFDVSSTWTKPAGAVHVLVECWGAGASGTAGTMAAPGGGGGAYRTIMLDAASVSNSETVTIGAGGVRSTSSHTNGGNSSFGSHLTAPGGKVSLNATYLGQGGDQFYYQATLDGYYAGGNGGQGSSGVYNGGDSTYGGGGGAGANGAGSSYVGVGGNSTYGGSGGASAYNTNASDGQIPGGGGGSVGQSSSGHYAGGGGHGRVRVTTYFG